MKGMPVKIGLCLLLVKDLLVSALEVNGSVGGAVTLRCTYSITSGATSMCWGKGGCPNRMCTDEIIWTDGQKVTHRKSDRYQLLGDLTLGNVSLTIMNLTKDDEGRYCCRVEIPGWFNDQKDEITVKVHKAPDDEQTPSGDVTSTATTWRIFGTLKGKQDVDQDEVEQSHVDNNFNPVIAGVVIIILLVVLLGIVSAWRYYKIRNKDKSRNIGVLTLEGIHGRENQTEQNIYSL